MCVDEGVYTIYVYAGRERENERIWREREKEREHAGPSIFTGHDTPGNVLVHTIGLA